MTKKESPTLKNQTQRTTPTQKWLIAIFTLILVFLIGSYIYLDHYYSRETTAQRFVTAIQKNHPKQVAALIRTDDPDFKINVHNVQPLINYYRNNPNQIKKLKRRMSTTGVVNNDMDFVDTGHHFFLFEKFLLEVKPIFPTIESNRSHTQITINGKLAAQNLRKHTVRTFGPLIPGRYHIQATTTVRNKPIVLSRQFEWIEPTAADLKVTTNFK